MGERMLGPITFFDLALPPRFVQTLDSIPTTRPKLWNTVRLKLACMPWQMGK